MAADRYLAAEACLAGGRPDLVRGLQLGPARRRQCRHNLLYWRGGDWWGFGPGAHSHVGGVRWWNVKHPSAYAGRLADGPSPAQAREVLTAADRHVEEVMLGLRLADGLPLGALAGRRGRPRIRRSRTACCGEADRAVLTLRGRLLADAVVRASDSAARGPPCVAARGRTTAAYFTRRTVIGYV